MPWYIYVPITFLTWRGRVHAMVYLCSNDFLNLARIRPFHAMHVYLQFSNDFLLHMDASMSFVMCFTYLCSNYFLICQYCCFWNGYMDLF